MKQRSVFKLQLLTVLSFIILIENLNARACDDATDIIGKATDVLTNGIPSPGSHFQELELIMIQYDGLLKRIESSTKHLESNISSYNKNVDHHTTLHANSITNAQSYVTSGSYKIALQSLETTKSNKIRDRANELESANRSLKYSKEDLEKLKAECETCTKALNSNAVSFLAQSSILGSWGQRAQENAQRCGNAIIAFEKKIAEFEDKIKKDDSDHQNAITNVDSEISRVRSMLNMPEAPTSITDTNTPNSTDTPLGDMAGYSEGPVSPPARATSPETNLNTTGPVQSGSGGTATPSTTNPPIHQNYKPPIKYTEPIPTVSNSTEVPAASSPSSGFLQNYGTLFFASAIFIGAFILISNKKD